MGRKVKTDGRIEKLALRLRALIDESTQLSEIALKYRMLSGLVAKKVTVEDLIGSERWKELQQLLDQPDARAVLAKQPKPDKALASS